MCSLEVPDIEQAIGSHYQERDDVVVLLANAGDGSGLIQSFLQFVPYYQYMLKLHCLQI